MSLFILDNLPNYKDKVHRNAERYVRFINTREHRTIPEGAYTEKHHIIPRCMKGSNEDANLIVLTAREHYIAHVLLSRAYPKNVRLMKSLGAMSMLKDKRCFSSRQFAVIREASSLSKHGKNNHMYGKFGKDNPNYGRKHTEESKKKMSIANSGKNSALSGVTGKAHPKYGKEVRSETRRKLSIAFSGKNNPMYGKFGKDHPAYGRVVTEKERQRMSFNKSGENHHYYGKRGHELPNFKGYYETPFTNELFESYKSVSEYLDSSIHIVWQMYNNGSKKISTQSYNAQKFLKTLGVREDIVGKSFEELGFLFHSKEETQVV